MFSMGNTKDFYVRIAYGTSGLNKFVKASELPTLTPGREVYLSPFYYSSEQVQTYQKTKSLAGTEPAFTDQLWFDFDKKDNPEEARQDAIKAVNRLKKSGFAQDAIQIYFSGNKGFHLVVQTNKEFSYKQVRAVAESFQKEMPTLDLTVYLPTQILRAPLSKHGETSLFKIPLSETDLTSKSVGEIREMATRQPRRNIGEMSVSELPSNFLPEVSTEKPQVKESKQLLDDEIDFDRMPKGWKDYRWAVAHAYKITDKGNRTHCMMIVASTCRALRYPEEVARAHLERFDRLYSKNTGQGLDPERVEKTMRSVYSETWRGGQYSPETDKWLAEYCEKNGFNTSTPEKISVVGIDEAFNMYRRFVETSSNYIVPTGIPKLDKRLKMTVGKLIGLVAPPSAGKTSFAIQVLNEMAKQGQRGIFFSYDMYVPLVIQKLMQRHTDMSEEEIKESIENLTPETEQKFRQILKENYGTIDICFQAGQTPNDIVRTLEERRAATGEEINFIVIDYNELISSELSDNTAASSDVAKQLRAIANNHNVGILLLLQPNKMAGNPRDEMNNYRSIKGSSMLEQSMDVIIGVSRPGFDPETPENDKYLVLNCLKNRFGGLFRFELRFEGYSGTISDDLTQSEKDHMRELKKHYLEEKSGKVSASDEDREYIKNTTNNFRKF